MFGGSNKGKTKLASLLGFYEMSATEFHKVFGEDQKKVHKDTITAIRKSGLVHGDDIQSHIPEAIKSMKDTAKIDLMYGGMVEVPVKFLLVSSTNDEITSTMNEEWGNRLLTIDIQDDGYDVTTSPVALKKHTIYEEHCGVYIQKRILEILAKDVTISDLRDLQNKYKLDISNNERGETIDDVKEIISKGLLASLGDDVVYHESKPYVKKLKDVNAFIKDTLQDNLNGLYISNFNNELAKLKKYFTSTRTSFRVKDVPTPYYPLRNCIDEDDF